MCDIKGAHKNHFLSEYVNAFEVEIDQTWSDALKIKEGQRFTVVIARHPDEGLFKVKCVTKPQLFRLSVQNKGF